MLKNRLIVSIIVFGLWTEVAPVGLGTLEFDNLDSNLDDLKYEAEVEDLSDYYDSLNNEDDGSELENDNSKTKTKILGFEKKKSKNKGLKTKHNEQDLKKFLKAVGAKDNEAFNDEAVYGAVEGLAAEAIGATGNKERKYRKGSKTRGFHRVHHKDEYKKDKEFYEDDETSAGVHKIGGKILGYKIGGGASFDKGHSRHNRLKGIFGIQGYSDKGLSNKQYSDYSNARGLEGSFNNES